MSSGARPGRPGAVECRVDVWRVGLEQERRYVERARSFLDRTETSALDAVVEPHRTHRLVARASLRAVLSRYLDVLPADVAFTYGPHGKPQLAGRPSSPVEFNLSSSGDVCVIAVTTTGPVGVDVEQVRPVPDAGRIARRFFAASEVAALGAGAQPGEGPGEGLDVRRFLRYWTAKEAYAKAIGAGLSLPLSEIVIPPEVERDERVTLPVADAEPWALVRVDPGPGAVATLAVRAVAGELVVVAEELDPERAFG